MSEQPKTAQPRLYLASASPRRHELLQQIGVAHEVLHVPAPPGEDEPRMDKEPPIDYVQRTALDKAIRAQYWLEQVEKNNDAVLDRSAILTADTTVCIGDLVLGKPKDHKDAEAILRKLAGRTHTVYTALVLSQIKLKEQTKWRQWRALSETLVTFSEMQSCDIDEYIATGEPFGKAGAYGIQGHAAKFICKIAGSYTGVMGLPLFETNEILKELH